MNDDELDNWLLEHNARLVEQTRTSVDLAARYREIHNAVSPGKQATVGRSARWLTTLAIVVGAVAVSQTPEAPPPEPSTAVPSPKPDEAGALPQELVVFRGLSGPAGLTTMAPVDWKAGASTRPDGIFELRDPENPARYLRFGATRVGTANLAANVKDAESLFAMDVPSYEDIRMTPTTFNGANAIEWEFRFDLNPGRGGEQRAYALYWEVGAYCYVIYASAPASQWNEMMQIFHFVRARTEVAAGTP